MLTPHRQFMPIAPRLTVVATMSRLRLPAGLIALGDAVCALCPVYGQGMTVSALAAKTLQTWLNKSTRGKLDNNRFQKQLAKSNSFHWMLATSQDSRFPTTVRGQQRKNRPIDKLMTGYMNRLLTKSASEPDLHLMFLEVAHLLRSPLYLYHPAVVWQVLTSSKNFASD
jgi:2-polyprenyl-6-methoxyphenol hydroxylase-like FAD-dependent oxidoreductase